MAKWTVALASLALAASSMGPAIATDMTKCTAKTDVPSATTIAPATETAAPSATTVAPAAESWTPTATTVASTTETEAPTAVADESTTATPAPSASGVSEVTDAPEATGSSTSGSSAVQIRIDPNTTAVSTIESTYTNWVGPTIGSGGATCYREAHIAETCPYGFDSSLGTCWAQCPLATPVECATECLPQSDDCATEIAYKVGTVAYSALMLATLGVFGEFAVMAKGVQLGIKCAKNMVGMVRNIMRFIRTIQTTAPETSQEQLLTLLYSSDNVVVDLPVTIMTCLGLPVPAKAGYTDEVLTWAEMALADVMNNGDYIMSSWDNFKSFLSNIGSIGDSVQDLGQEDITDLESALASNSTCGYDMKRMTDRIWMKVEELREATPDISEDDMRVAMSKTDLVLNEIPIVTNNCMEELIAESDLTTAYETRDTLRKTFATIVDDLVETGTSNNGSTLSSEEFALAAADKGLGIFSVWDPSGISLVAAEFLQEICGPTTMIGEIDDGSATDALGLTTVGDAFNSSSGTWTKVGDGSVTITFTSVDTEDVTVNVLSGGDEIDNVDVDAGATATWTSTVEELGGKTLYLDRWRPGFLGLPGTGGGSLKLWIPTAAEGGHLELNAVLNET